MADNNKDQDHQRPHQPQGAESEAGASDTSAKSASGKAGEQRQRRRRSHSHSHRHSSSQESQPSQEILQPRRSSRTPRRLMLSIWLMIGLNFTLLIIGGMLLVGREEAPVYPQTQLQGMQLSDYERSINDAAYAGPDRVSNLLQPIDFTNPLLEWKTFPEDEYPEDRWLKVVLWLSQAHYQQTYQPLAGSGEIARTPADQPRIRVTLAPQVQQFCKRLTNDADHDVSYRLKHWIRTDAMNALSNSGCGPMMSSVPALIRKLMTATVT